MENGITMSDIAKVVGVSKVTVSRVLSNSPLVSEQIRNKVQRAAKRLNYRPNLIARSFARRKTQTIGVIITDIANPFFAEIVRGIENYAKQEDYHLLLGITGDNVDEERRCIESFLERRVDGILLIPVHKKYDDLAHIYMLKNEKVPFVLVSRNLEEVDTDYVMTDLRKGSYELVRYLIQLAHERILFVTGSKEVTHGKYRIQGYRDALTEADLDFDKRLLLEVKVATFEEGYKIGRKILSDKRDFDAIITANDVLALGILRAAIKLGVRVPDDFSLAGYDNVVFAEIAEVALTTVAQASQAIGEESVAILLDRIRDNVDQTDYKHVLLRPKLIIRNSCKCKCAC